MAILRRLVLLPLLAPALVALALAAANPAPPLSLRLLTWRSPSLPLGAWLAIGAAGGLAIGATASGLAVAGSRQRDGGADQGPPPRPQREGSESWSGWEDPAADTLPRQQRTAGAGPSRAMTEPAPTVTVPFRVIRRPAAPAAPAEPGAHRVARQEPVMVSDDDWGLAGSDDW